MRILLIYHAGAMETPRRIFQALAQAGNVELTVIVPQKLKVDRVYGPSGWLCVEREEYRAGYRLIPLPLRNPLNYGQGFEKAPLWHHIKCNRPDIIHVFDEPTSGYLFQVVWLRLTACPRSKVLFYGFDNIPIRFWRGWLSRVKHKLIWAQVAGGVAANSETLENVRRAGFPPNRPLQRIFWGIPTEIFKPMNRLVLRAELRLNYEHVVGYVGRLVLEKGLAVLLDAMRRLPSNVHCLIIGSGPMRAELTSSDLPELSARIHIFDVMEPEELVKYMNCMDVLAVPGLTTSYWKEQYGRVIGEAMACGVAVVGSDSGAIPEVIGSAGLIVPEGDAPALAGALHKALFDEDVQACLIQQGLERAERELSVKAMSRQLLDFYNRILRA